MEDFDKYMTKFHLAFTDLVNESSKPEVNAALYQVRDTVSSARAEYNNKKRQRQEEINEHRGEPGYIVPPDPERSKVCDLSEKLFVYIGSDVNEQTFRNFRECAKCVDPAYYDLEGDEKAVRKRKDEIAAVREPLMAESGRVYAGGRTLERMDTLNQKKTDEIATAQEYIDFTRKVSRLAAKKLKTLPDPKTLPEEIKTKNYKEYVSSLRIAANIQNRSRIIIKDTNRVMENLARASQALNGELEQNKNNVSKEFRQSVENNADVFTKHYFTAKEKAKGFADDQDMMAYIDVRKHERSCIEAAMNVDYTREQIFDVKESKQVEKVINALNADIRRSDNANNVFIRHNDYDNAVRAMKALAVNLKEYQDFTRNQSNSGNTEQEILENTEKKAKALRESAAEAAKKLEAYLERKSRSGSLNEKGQKRVETFQKALKTTKSIGHICDNRLFETDARIIAIGNAKMLESDLQAANEKAIAYQEAADNKSLSGIERTAAQHASIGVGVLKDLAAANRELNEKEKALAKDAFASIIIFEENLLDPKSNPTQAEYAAQVSVLSHDPAFGRAVNLSSACIRDFIACEDISDEASKIYDKFFQDKYAERESQVNKENVNKQQKRQKERNFENKGPVKNPF